MRRTLTILAIGVAALALPIQTGAAAAAPPPDPWHFVQHFGRNWSACDAKGRADVSNGWAGAYDCRRVGSVVFPSWDLWEA